MEKEETKDYLLEKIVFRSEPYTNVPCYLLKPKRIRYPAPAMICLQGHTSGMHISFVKVKYEHDKAAISGDRDFALQAVENGFIALAIEQRSFGERKEQVQKRVSPHGYHDAVMHSLMLGKTLQGERVWDVMRGVDLLMEMDEVEKKYIACMGNSGGGTTTFYAACMDTRISGAIVSCSFCTYADSIMKIYHCADNYIPGVLKVAEMYDLTGCIAPRPFLIVAGKKDEIFPIHGVEKAYKRAKRIYRAAGAPRNIKLVVGDDGHRFYRDPSWRFSKEMLGIH